MNRIQILAATGFGHVLRFDHPSGEEHEDERQEESQSHAVSFVENGRFSVIRKSEFWEFHTGDILLSYPDTLQTFRHLDRIPNDVCLSVHFVAGTIEETTGKSSLPVASPHISASSRSLFLLHHLKLALENRELLAIEERMLALVPAFTIGSDCWNGNLHRSQRFDHYVNRATQACELLEAEYDQQHSLLELARKMAMSPFHFARVFKELVGRSAHQYLVEIRLARAATRLRQGATVTDAAFASGFGSLSHFIRMFKKHYKVSPLAYKRAPRRG